MVPKQNYAVVIFSFNNFLTTAHISGMYLTLQHRPQGLQSSIDYTLNYDYCTVTCDYSLIVIYEVLIGLILYIRLLYLICFAASRATDQTNLLYAYNSVTTNNHNSLTIYILCKLLRHSVMSSLAIASQRRESSGNSSAFA